MRLSDYRGKRVVLYFYPKDDTPGCTTQACGFRDNYLEIEEKNAIVLGVSPDGAKSHQKFKTKFNLPFTLLADEDHSIAEAYGVWVEKSMYGNNVYGDRAQPLCDRRERQDRGCAGQGEARTASSGPWRRWGNRFVPGSVPATWHG